MKSKVIASKIKQFKLWQKNRKRKDWKWYKNVSTIMKSVVNKAKLNRHDELY